MREGYANPFLEGFDEDVEASDDATSMELFRNKKRNHKKHKNHNNNNHNNNNNNKNTNKNTNNNNNNNNNNNLGEAELKYNADLTYNHKEDNVSDIDASFTYASAAGGGGTYDVNCQLTQAQNE